MWRLPGTRHVVMQGTGPDGAFAIGGLPAGEYYVGVASDLDESSFASTSDIDPDILETLRPSSTVVSVGDGQEAHVSLRLKAQ